MITLDLAFLVQIVNFGLLVLILNVCLYRPIRALLAQRRQEIQSARERTVAVDEQVQAKVAEYELRLREAKAEVGAKKSESLKAAQVEETALLGKARQEAAASISAIRDRVQKESEEARLQLKQQVDALSNAICEKILGRSL